MSEFSVKGNLHESGREGAAQDAQSQSTGRREHRPDMDYLISLLVLLPCARASSPGSLGQLVPFARNGYHVYASDSSGEEYEPYAVAALPLHAPVPVLRVLTPRARRPARRPRPDSDLYALGTSHAEHSYEPVRYESEGYEPVAYEHVYAEQDPPPKRTKARDQYEDEASSLVVYARPNKHGGFSYRKPSAVTPAPRLREPQEPVIIRIHKYRVIH